MKNTHGMVTRCRVCVLVLMLGAFAAIVAPAGAAEEGDRHLAKLTLRGVVSENGSAELSLFGGSAQMLKLRDVTAAIASAAKNESVQGLVLRLKGATMGRSQRETLRRALVDFRESGKPSYCYLESAGLGDYMLASACSEISLAPVGSIELPGVGMQKIFFKGLLDKVGVHMQELRMGRYKSAVEPYTRDEPSGPVREETEALLDSLFEDTIDALAENLGRKPIEIRGLIDHALFSAEEALEHGLVKRVEFEDEMLARVRGKEGLAMQSAMESDSTPQAPGFAGMMQIFNELFSPTVESTSEGPKIAVIHGTGAIDTGGGMPNPLAGGEAMTSDEMVKVFRKVRKDDTVKAVVFRVDSPGGSALASDLIAREVELTAKVKPVVVSMADLAASGGYYVSAPATWIIAEPTTLTGSIGVIGGVMDMTGAYELAGVRMETFSRGKRAEIVSAYGRLSDEGREILMESMRDVYDRFLGIVAKGREIPVSAVASVAEGRVWTGRQALEIGLVDQVGNLDDALAKARALSSSAADIETIYLPKPKTLFDLMNPEMGASVGLGATVRHAVTMLPPELRSILHRISWVWTLRRERVLAVMPDLLEVR